MKDTFKGGLFKDSFASANKTIVTETHPNKKDKPASSPHNISTKNKSNKKTTQDAKKYPKKSKLQSPKITPKNNTQKGGVNDPLFDLFFTPTPAPKPQNQKYPSQINSQIEDSPRDGAPNKQSQKSTSSHPKTKSTSKDDIKNKLTQGQSQPMDDDIPKKNSTKENKTRDGATYQAYKTGDGANQHSLSKAAQSKAKSLKIKTYKVSKTDENTHNPEAQKSKKSDFQKIKIDKTKSDGESSVNGEPSKKAKSSNRLKYEAEVSVIKSKIGDLEDIRNHLGLSQRKICQLLMVDPSAWTRWQKNPENIPPHIYRSLQWYTELITKDPIWHPKNSFFTQNSLKEEFKQKEALQVQKWEQLWHFHSVKTEQQLKAMRIRLYIVSFVSLGLGVIATFLSIYGFDA